MGFPSKGVEAVSAYLSTVSDLPVVGMNVVKNTEQEGDEVPKGYQRVVGGLDEFSDFFVINVSCPNVPGLREFQERNKLQLIIDAIAEVNPSKKPVLVKFSPDLTVEQINDALNTCIDCGIDGVVATNSSTSRDILPEASDLRGGLTGQLIKPKSLDFVNHIYSYTKGKLPIIGIGGIASPEDAIAMIRAGASLIAMYTGLVYEGPGLARRINHGIVSYLKQNNLESISDLVGADHQLMVKRERLLNIYHEVLMMENDPDLRNSELRPEGVTAESADTTGCKMPDLQARKALAQKLEEVEKVIKRTLRFKGFNSIDGKPALIPVHWKKGASPLVLVLGENASGKSFFRKVVITYAEEFLDYECIDLAMDSRTGPGFGNLKYMPEKQFSTGYNSISAFHGSISTSDARDNFHVLFWDEPDIGLSDSVSAGMGVEIHDFILNKPESKGLAFLTTHSRAMVEQLVDLNPHYIYLGENPPETLKDWLERPIVPQNLSEVEEAGLAKFREIGAFLHSKD